MSWDDFKTSDESLDEACRAVECANGGPLALTIGQATSLLARLAQPDDGEKLAELSALKAWSSAAARRLRVRNCVPVGRDRSSRLAATFGATGALWWSAPRWRSTDQAVGRITDE